MKFFGIVFSGLVIVLVSMTSCNGIPSGTPPSGDIVAQDEVKNVYSSAAAVNYLITSLSTFAVKNIPADSRIAQKFSASDTSLNFYPDKVFKSAAAIAKFTGVPEGRIGDYQLISSIKESRSEEGILIWEMSLVSAKLNSAKDVNNTVWSETIKIDQGKLE
ncbi:MAG: hypothetical protein ACYC4Q_00895 [Victivallaceae bacterium]